MPQTTAVRGFADPRPFLRAAPQLAAESSPTTADHRIAAMAAMLALQNPATTADALRILRLAYPHAPLALRLAALAAAMNRPQPI